MSANALLRTMFCVWILWQDIARSTGTATLMPAHDKRQAIYLNAYETEEACLKALDIAHENTTTALASLPGRYRVTSSCLPQGVDPLTVRVNRQDTVGKGEGVAP